MHLSGNEKKALAKLKDLLKKARLGLVALRLFGSKARGDYTQESDVDIAVILDEVDQAVEQEVFDICFEVGLEYDLLLSPIVLSVSETNSSKHKITPFFKILEREGIAV